jgi:hypothetical protein
LRQRPPLPSACEHTGHGSAGTVIDAEAHG